MRRILVIKLRYIGDVLLATPVLRALKHHDPHAQVCMVVSQGTEGILRHNPDVDEVLVVPRGGSRRQAAFLWTLRRRRFDLVIDLTDGDRAAFLARWSGAPRRIGFNEEGRWRGTLYTDVVRGRPGQHRVERDLDALKPLGLSSPITSPVLKLGAEDARRADALLQQLALADHSGRLIRPLVMLHPGARYWFKSWPPERFAAVADHLAKTYGYRSVIGGGDQEREAAAKIVACASSEPVNVAGQVDLLAFAAILKRCSLFIGNDNGAMHMAAALGVPVVGLFGPSDPNEWGPRTNHGQVLYKGLDCRACFHPTCTRGEENCMRLITVEEVIHAAAGLLAPRDAVSVHR